MFREHDEFERDWGEERFGPAPRKPLGEPRLHQRNIDSAFIVAIFLATVALLLCAVR